VNTEFGYRVHCYVLKEAIALGIMSQFLCKEIEEKFKKYSESGKKNKKEQVEEEEGIGLLICALAFVFYSNIKVAVKKMKQIKIGMSEKYSELKKKENNNNNNNHKNFVESAFYC